MVKKESSLFDENTALKIVMSLLTVYTVRMPTLLIFDTWP
jgi:hypothetical protein